MHLVGPYSVPHSVDHTSNFGANSGVREFPQFTSTVLPGFFFGYSGFLPSLCICIYNIRHSRCTSLYISIYEHAIINSKSLR